MVANLLPRLLLILTTLTVLVSCQTFEIADITPLVRLPASQDCYGISVLSQEEKRIPKAECDEILKTSVIIPFEDYQKQRFVAQKNCQMAKCKQLVGAFDNLFLSIDSGLQKLSPLK